MSSRIPFSVRATDVVHRLSVLGLVGICVGGTGAIFYNVWANSDYAKMNQGKLTFDKSQYEEARKKED